MVTSDPAREHERMLDLSNALLGEGFDSLLAASVEIREPSSSLIHLWVATPPTSDERETISVIETEFMALVPFHEAPEVDLKVHIGYPRPDEEALPGRRSCPIRLTSAGTGARRRGRR